MIKNKKEALEHLEYIEHQIERMTTGNLTHHRNSIGDNLKELRAFLKKGSKK